MYTPGLCRRDYAWKSTYPPRSWRNATAKLVTPWSAPTTRSSGCLPKASSPARLPTPPAISPEWIGEISRRYDEGGAEGPGDRRHRNPGAAPLLSPEQQGELAEALSEPPEDGGMWNSSKVALRIEERTGRRVRAQRGWEYLRRLGYTPQVPRPAHAGTDPEEQEAFKKGSPSG